MAPLPALLSSLRFGSYLVYSPRGSSDVSRRSRAIRDAIKAGDQDLLDQVAARLASQVNTTGLGAVLGPDVILVPTPRSAPLVIGGLWPPKLLADALVAAGLGRSVLPCLERVEAVPKSAFARPGERPNAQRHYETLRIVQDLGQLELLASKRITLVDDFLTKGNTLLGGASRLAEAYPMSELAAFGLVRTLGRQPEIAQLIDPCVGTITRGWYGEADRSP